MSASNVALALSALGVIGALVGSLGAASAVFGHSRELEAEADQVGFERAVRAGYSPHEGIRVFQSLDEEAKILAIKEPLIFASHPKLEERIESYRTLIATGAAGELLNTEQFNARTAKLREFWLDQELGAGQYKSLIHHLANPLRAERFGNIAWFYLGEAYRLRGEKEDEGSAEAAYWESLTHIPNHPPSVRGLGLLYLRRGQIPEAHRHFKRYIELAPAAKDVNYIKAYLEPAPPAPVQAVETKNAETPSTPPAQGNP